MTKKIILLVLLSLLLVGCKQNIVPPQDDEDIPLVPLEPSTPKEDDMITIERSIDKEELVNVKVDVKDFEGIKIRFWGGGSYPIPFDLLNFKVDGVDVKFTGVEKVQGKNPLIEHWFNIGTLVVFGNLVHNRKSNLGIFNVHDNDEIGFISVLTKDVETFEFDFMVTTNAYQYFNKVTITRYVEVNHE